MANIKTGRIVAATGLKGELIFLHDLGKKTDLKNLRSVLLEVKKDELLPYFIESAKGKTETETLIKLEGIETMEQAKLLTRKNVWLSEEDFNKQVAKQAPTAMLGYQLFNKEEQVGEIVGVLEQVNQILCTVAVGEKEALVPVHADNLLDLDHKKEKGESSTARRVA